MLYLSILNKNQLKIAKILGFLRKRGFYLGGGTGLALQLGHRTSVDFDFYTPEHFDSALLTKKLAKFFPKIRIRFQAKDTLGVEINGVGLSFFRYDYPLIGPLRNCQGISLASVEDIAAMKIAAIVQRGTRRDFIDIYYLLEKYPLKKIVEFSLRKYPGYQDILVIRALLYFVDAEKETKPRKIKIFDKNFSWEKAKEKIFAEVKKYQLEMTGKKF
jgi:hypothetical protein